MNAYATSSAPDRRRPRIQPRQRRYRYVRARWRVLAGVIDIVGWLVFGPWRLLHRALARQRPQLNDAPRLLVVQLDHFGDAVLSTGLLHALRRRFPRAEIDVLSGQWNASFFRALPEVSAVHVLDRNRFARGESRGWLGALVAMAWRLRAQRYELAIDVRGECPIALLMWLAGARTRVGWPAGGGGFLLTHPVAFQRSRSEAQSRQALLAALDINGSLADATPLPCVTVDEKALAQWREQIAQQEQTVGPGRGPRVALHLGAGTDAKRWSADAWRELLGRLIVERDANIVLVGSPGERQLAADVCQGQAWPQVVDLIGRVPLEELSAVLASCDAVIGGDSGPAHLAAAVGTPAVVLFSGTNDPQQWAPIGARVAVLKSDVACSPCHREQCCWSDHPCMQGLTPAAVLAELGRLLGDAPVGESVGEPALVPLVNALPPAIAQRLAPPLLVAAGRNASLVTLSEGRPT